MKRRMLSKMLCVTMVCASIFSFSGCSETGNVGTVNSVAGTNITKLALTMSSKKTPTVTKEEMTTAVTDFGVKLLQNNGAGEENVLISPLSIVTALTMTANGAKRNTFNQMRDTLGMGIGDLNKYLYETAKNLPSSDTYQFSQANSIWIKDDGDFQVSEKFIQAIKKNFDASVFQRSFNEDTIDEINQWVSDETGGTIKNMLNSLSKDAIMYLINALAFDAQWQNIYNEYQVGYGTFTSASGEKQKAEMMHSTESVYLSDDEAEGVLKYYDNQKYAFVALLPKEGTTLKEYVSNLTGAKIMNLLKGKQNLPVETGIVKFKSEYSVELNKSLINMGMVDAFDPWTADFRGIGTYRNSNIYISRVLHKSFIEVNERGTKAGAATVVEMSKATCIQPDTKYIRLDRPFLYMIIDCENNLPIFLGTTVELVN